MFLVSSYCSECRVTEGGMYDAGRRSVRRKCARVDVEEEMEAVWNWKSNYR